MPQMSSTAYKPRKRRRHEDRRGGRSTDSPAPNEPPTRREQRPFPLVNFFRPVKGTVSTTAAIALVLIIAGLFRWCLSIWPYSGLARPPMHGDFEAQRHWMEITIHLPVSHWYWHDLEWWGLDYPPLTAYHSWLCGTLGQLIDPDWFTLYQSRGIDDKALKVFMRATVIVSEYLTYIPAMIWAVGRIGRDRGTFNSWDQVVALTAILTQPATMLIDHGHFQYNTVMLGFTSAAVAAMLAKKYALSCAAFVGALGFKQMALFYAPAVASYLLGTFLTPRLKLLPLCGLAAVTFASFATLTLPMMAGTAFDEWQSTQLPSSAVTPPLLEAVLVPLNEKAFYYPFVRQIGQIIHRVFPLARGLFEDKVANIWCALHSSGIHKLTRYSPALLQRAALGLTLASILPPCLILLLSKRRQYVLLEGLAACSWGFFLCGFQVHEKSVLLPLLPMTMMLAYSEGMRTTNRAWIGLANILGCWTMFPLLKRDGLRLPYFVLTGLWAWLMGLPPFTLDVLGGGGLDIFSSMAHATLYVAMIIWHFVEATIPPPDNKPDIWIVVNVCIGCAGFGLCYLWSLWKCLANSGLINPERQNSLQEKKVQ